MVIKRSSHGRKSSTPPAKSSSTRGSTDESSAGYEDDFSQNRIRVGRSYQATIPKFIPEENRKQLEDEPERALMVWSHEACPIAEQDLVIFAREAHGLYKYTPEQSLGMLFFHRFNFEKASCDMKNYTPWQYHVEDDWSVEEMKLFRKSHEQIMLRDNAIDFDKMSKAIRTKNLGAIMRYYYTKFFRFTMRERDIEID